MAGSRKLCLPDCEQLHRSVPIQLFESAADPENLEVVFSLESMTNGRLRDEAGDLRLSPDERKISLEQRAHEK